MLDQNPGHFGIKVVGRKIKWASSWVGVRVWISVGFRVKVKG